MDKNLTEMYNESICLFRNEELKAYLRRAFLFLEDGDWKNADQYCEKALDINPECVEAYIGKLMAELCVNRQENLKNCKRSFSDNSNYQKAIRFGNEKLKNELNGYIAYIKENTKNLKTKIAVGFSHVVGLKADGTLIVDGHIRNEACKVKNWTDIVEISAGWSHTVGLKADGTVVATGDCSCRECEVQDWTDIIAISAGHSHTVGLNLDGTVIAVGSNSCGECEVQDWTDIVAISAGGSHTVGLKADGTVIATSFYEDKVQDWTDIVAISAGNHHIVGLKEDGTVIAAGLTNYDEECAVRPWEDIVAISAGPRHTAGLKADGTVVVTWNGVIREYQNVEYWNLFE